MNETTRVQMLNQINEGDKPAIEQQAKLIVKSIAHGSNEREIEDQIEQIGLLGHVNIQQSHEVIKQLQVPVKDVGDAHVTKQLLELRSQLEQITPNHIKIHKPGGVSGILNRLRKGNPLSQFIQKHEYVETQVKVIVNSLYESQHMLNKRIALLKERRHHAEDAIYVIKKDIATLEQIYDFLNHERQHAESAERKVLMEEAIAQTLRRMQSMHLRIASYLKTIASSKVLSQTGKDLVVHIDDMAPLAEVVLNETFTLILALQEQEDVAKGIHELQDMMSNLIQYNAQRIQAHAENTNDIRTKPMLQLDKVKSAYDILNAAFDQMEESNRQVMDSSRKVIAEVSELNDRMESRARGHKQERILIQS